MCPVQTTYQTKHFERDEKGGWVYKHKKYAFRSPLVCAVSPPPLAKGSCAHVCHTPFRITISLEPFPLDELDQWEEYEEDCVIGARRK